MDWIAEEGACPPNRRPAQCDLSTTLTSGELDPLVKSDVEIEYCARRLAEAAVIAA
jgi:hypothetical protein